MLIVKLDERPISEQGVETCVQWGTLWSLWISWIVSEDPKEVSICVFLIESSNLKQLESMIHYF